MVSRRRHKPSHNDDSMQNNTSSTHTWDDQRVKPAGHPMMYYHSYLHGFEDGSDALASPDAHSDQRILASDAAQFIEGLHRQDTARRPDGVPKRDPAAVGIGAIQRQGQVPHDRPRPWGQGR